MSWGRDFIARHIYLKPDSPFSFCDLLVYMPVELPASPPLPPFNYFSLPNYPPPPPHTHTHAHTYTHTHTQVKCPFLLVFYPSCRSRKSKLFIRMFIILFSSVLFHSSVHQNLTICHLVQTNKSFVCRLDKSSIDVAWHDAQLCIGSMVHWLQSVIVLYKFKFFGFQILLRHQSTSLRSHMRCACALADQCLASCWKNQNVKICRENFVKILAILNYFTRFKIWAWRGIFCPGATKNLTGTKRPTTNNDPSCYSSEIR